MNTEIAINEAIREGLRVFWSHTHTGQSREFLAASWEEAGYFCDEAGNPARDPLGNTIAKFEVREIDPESVHDCESVVDWYEGY